MSLFRNMIGQQREITYRVPRFYLYVQIHKYFARVDSFYFLYKKTVAIWTFSYPLIQNCSISVNFCPNKSFIFISTTWYPQKTWTTFYSKWKCLCVRTWACMWVFICFNIICLSCLCVLDKRWHFNSLFKILAYLYVYITSIMQ